MTVTRAIWRAVRAVGALLSATLVACGGGTGPGDAATARVQLSDSIVTIRVGDDTALTASARDAAGHQLAGRPIFWSSRDTSIATISQAGVIHGVTAGSTQISANTEGQSAIATVTVMARPVASLTTNPVTAQLVVGARQRLTAQAFNDLGAPVVTTTTWTSLDPGIVSVSADGEILALAPGVGSVRATAAGISATAVIVVIPVPVASVTVAPATTTLVVGATQQLAATPADSSGHALAGRAVAWTSRDPGIAAVSSTGQVTGIAPGTATVVVTVEGKTATATITVRPAPVATVTVTPATSSVGVGGTVRLAAATADASGHPLAGRAVAWTSSAPAVARVDTAGTVTGVAAGTATITAQSEGVTGSASVRVVAPPPAAVASVDVSPSAVTLATGTTRTLTATPRASNGAALTGHTVAWSSNTPAVATVTSGGVVTAVAPGTAQILAKVDGITGAATVTVQRAPVASVTVTPANTTLPAGSTASLTATPRDAKGAALTGRVVTWASSNDSVATVTSDGVVTGVSPGTATIGASSEGVTGSATVTVTAVVHVWPTAVTVSDHGRPDQRDALLIVTDQTGSIIPGDAVTWSSSDPTVATVTGTPIGGLVRGVSSGGSSATATITASYHGATATATVTVTH